MNAGAWREALPLLPTQAIGSGPAPGWLWLVREAIADGRIGGADIREAFEDSASIALGDMEAAGLDIVSTARCSGAISAIVP